MSRHKKLITSAGTLTTLITAAAIIAGTTPPPTQTSLDTTGHIQQTSTSLSSTGGLDTIINNILNGAQSSTGQNPLKPPTPTKPATTTHPVGINPTLARQMLNGIPVKGRAPKTGYKRAEFGTAWADNVDVLYGRDGCSQRENILQRDLTNKVMHQDGCRVISGNLKDPYTANTIQFVRGQQTSQLVPIDHIVSLSQAWQKGAQQWTFEKRRQFANDPANLLATSREANSQKSDGDAATWQPSNKAFRCTYATAQINVIHKYGLWVTKAEQDALYANLNRCG